MKPFIQELENLDILKAFAAIHHIPYSILFDSADLNHESNRYSFMACQPIETIEAKNGRVTITNWSGQTSAEGLDPFKIINERMREWVADVQTAPGLPPFQGGAAGLFSYDLGRYLEKIPDKAADNAATPDLAVGIYDQVLAYDHEKDKSWIITHAPGEEEARIKQKHLLRLLTQGKKVPDYKPCNPGWEPNFDAEEYQEKIEKVIEHIKAGDIFQANIAQRFDAKLPKDFDPFAHYLRLREINPAPFACYMNLGDIIISSSSPERFLTVYKGRAETRPIKGTRPHVDDPAADRLLRRKLQNSEKDRAENTMIVDLMRNDLSRVCKKDSVKVKALCRLETFAAVHHLVSIIEARLEDGKSSLDLLRACFPGGSITGAPKIRAMEIIEDIEPARRGPYCGSIAYAGFDGAMDSNILIRTLVYEGKDVCLQVGSGIVADSNADEEYQETFDKAAAIFRSFKEDANIEIEELFEDPEEGYFDELAKSA